MGPVSRVNVRVNMRFRVRVRVRFRVRVRGVRFTMTIRGEGYCWG
jgi:hypothetical protein